MNITIKGVPICGALVPKNRNVNVGIFYQFCLHHCDPGIDQNLYILLLSLDYSSLG